MKTILLFLSFLMSTLTFAQPEPKFALVLLENERIAEVNLDQDAFVQSLGNIAGISKDEFKDIDDAQKIAILIIAHKEGNPTIEVHANPEISDERKTQFLEKLISQNLANTKLLDFPILMLINSTIETYTDDFKDLISPVDQKWETYNNASLSEKYALNKAYATEALSVLSAYQVIVDDQFAGVKNVGKMVAETDFNKEQNVTALTSENPNYWRAMMEMSVGNQLIPVTKIFMLASQGEFDHAMRYIEIISAFSDPKSVPNSYLDELTERLDLFNQEMNARIQAGIVYHDKGEYSKALEAYNGVLNDYPNSAWAKYEVYFSQNALSVKNKELAMEDRSTWDKAKEEIYQSNPLYDMDVRASNGTEAYLMFRRKSISELFQKREDRFGDIYKYADIAMDLKVYDFAAQLFWISVTFDKSDNDALYKYLYCLEKLGVTGVKENFKGDFKKEFKKIEKEKEKEMTESFWYKTFEK